MVGWSVILIMIAYETNQNSMLILSQATEIVKGLTQESKLLPNCPISASLKKWQQKYQVGG